MKAAADGANIVIAAKTGEENPKLPGTIYSAAEESKILIFSLVFQNIILVSIVSRKSWRKVPALLGGRPRRATSPGCGREGGA